ncbi:unnamed protein product [Amoebophrya sp. A25]|nr:unnamed protein product [Amoebophrya sp. A25]|eukprot:GSA25T00013166001.1
MKLKMIPPLRLRTLYAREKKTVDCPHKLLCKKKKFKVLSGKAVLRFRFSLIDEFRCRTYHHQNTISRFNEYFFRTFTTHLCSTTLPSPSRSRSKQTKWSTLSALRLTRPRPRSWVPKANRRPRSGSPSTLKDVNPCVSLLLPALTGRRAFLRSSPAARNGALRLISDTSNRARWESKCRMVLRRPSTLAKPTWSLPATCQSLNRTP